MHELVADIEQEMAVNPGLHAYRPVLLHAYALRGETTRARELLDEELVGGFVMPQVNSWNLAMTTWADAAAAVGHLEAAAALHEILLPYHGQVVTTHVTVHPAVAHYLGLLDHTLGNLDSADAWFTEATDIHRRMESPLLTAYTDAAWAALLADRDRRDDRTRARAMAEQALAAATAGGYGYIERDARAVLERLG
jgi:hypothetical protein